MSPSPTVTIKLPGQHLTYDLHTVVYLRGTHFTTVRNMGNFNLFQTHVLTFFHHVEQCCYPSFLFIPHIPAMTSHVAYVINATIMLITTQGLCNSTFLPFVFLSYASRTVLFLMLITFLFSFHIHVALLTL